MIDLICSHQKTFHMNFTYASFYLDLYSGFLIHGTRIDPQTEKWIADSGSYFYLLL